MSIFLIGVLFVTAVVIMTVPAALLITDLWRQRVRSHQS